MLPADEAAVAGLLAAYQREFAALIDTDTSVESGRMTSTYKLPDGNVLLAEDDGEPVGCAAWKRLGATCEMKRLVVAPGQRGRGVGRMLGQAIMEDAAAHGLTRMFLVTTPQMRAAAMLYAALGFQLCEPVRPTRVEAATTLDIALPTS